MTEKRSDNSLENTPTREEFEQAVRRGLGRAVLWLSQGFAADREFLLHACTHDFSYDSIEDNRALYMFDVIKATGDTEYYARAVESALTEFIEDDRSVYQIFDLMGLLAKDGDLAARRSLYAFFEQRTEEDDYRRAEVFVDIDGLEGYLYIIRRWIQHPRTEDDHWYEAFLLEKTEERFGAEHVQAFLEQAAQTEPSIGVYMAEVREKRVVWKTRQQRRTPQPETNYKEMHSLVCDPSKRFIRPRAARWGAKLSEDDAEQIARDLLAETDPDHLERYLFLFGQRPFPLDHTPLLLLARDGEPKVVSAARRALSRISHPSVRALALELLPSAPHPRDLVQMLTRSFQEGDEKVIERTLKEPWDADEFHDLGLAVRDVFEENLTPMAFDALISYYEQGLCTMCRHGAIELLAEIGPLPDYLVAECRYDAFDSTREIMQAIADKETEPKA